MHLKRRLRLRPMILPRQMPQERCTMLPRATASEFSSVISLDACFSVIPIIGSIYRILIFGNVLAFHLSVTTANVGATFPFFEREFSAIVLGKFGCEHWKWQMAVDLCNAARDALARLGGYVGDDLMTEAVHLMSTNPLHLRAGQQHRIECDRADNEARANNP